MKTWNDYKEHVKEVDPESGKTMEEVNAEPEYHFKNHAASGTDADCSEVSRI